MKVDTADAIGGTTLEDILNENQGIILPAGLLLTEPLVKALINQNVAQVDVEFTESDLKNKSVQTSDSPNTSKQDTAFEDRVNQLFLRHRGPNMKELQQCLLQSENLNS